MLLAVLWIRIRFDSGRLDLDPDSDRQNDPQKKKKSEEMYCFEVLDVLF